MERIPYYNIIGILIKGRQLDTDRHTGRTSCNVEGRDWADVPTSQGMPLPANRQKLGEGMGLILSPSPQRNRLCQHLDLGLVATRTEKQ